MRITAARGGSIRRSALACAVVAAIIPSLTLQTGGASSHNNLLPNPSFERSVVEPPAPVPPYTNPQPLLPEGWVVEGSAGLFDHSQNDSRTGRRMAAISVPASGKRTTCTDPPNQVCVDDPTTDAKEDTLALAYSLPPAWRNAVPIQVLGNTDYVLKGYMKVSFVTAGEAALMRVRWLDANGVPIRLDDGGKLVSSGQLESPWTFRTATIKSPPAARSAVILLSHTTDTWIGQVRFDDVYFGRG